MMGKEGTSKVRHGDTADIIIRTTTPPKDCDHHHHHWTSSHDPLDPRAPALPSIGEIRAVVPARCFARSYARSAYFLARDTAMAAGCVSIARRYLSVDLPTTTAGTELLLGIIPDYCGALIFWFAGWTAYSFCMGCVVTGHWVLAHECGHGAFTPSRTINDACGFVLHQALLVPYFSWQCELLVCFFVFWIKNGSVDLIGVPSCCVPQYRPAFPPSLVCLFLILLSPSFSPSLTLLRTVVPSSSSSSSSCRNSDERTNERTKLKKRHPFETPPPHEQHR